MDIPALQAFLAIAETGSFSLAAERLNLTQPAISKRIAQLESTLGTPLFDRVGRTIAPTEAGRALLPRARRILIEIEDSRRLITNLSGRIQGRLAFATSHHIGLHRLPPVLRRFHHTYPSVEMDLRFLDSEAACRAVDRGELEFALVTLPPGGDPNLELVPVWPDPLVVVTGRDHPLAGQATSCEALTAHPAILPRSGTYTRTVVDEAFHSRGLEPVAGLSTNYLETIKMLVAVGLGWSVLPATMADDEVAILSVEGLVLGRTLGLVRNRQRSLSNAARAMMELLGDEG